MARREIVKHLDGRPVIGFFSRLIIAFDIVPTVNASQIKRTYQKGWLAQGILLQSERKRELRADQRSLNTAWVTKEFFEVIGAELSFARLDAYRTTPSPSDLRNHQAGGDLPGGKLFGRAIRPGGDRPIC